LARQKQKKNPICNKKKQKKQTKKNRLPRNINIPWQDKNKKNSQFATKKKKQYQSSASDYQYFRARHIVCQGISIFLGKTKTKKIPNLPQKKETISIFCQRLSIFSTTTTTTTTPTTSFRALYFFCQAISFLSSNIKLI
jgi:hypothetical protein